MAQAAIVAAQGAIQVAFFYIDIVAQDGAAEAQVGAQVKQVVILSTNDFYPEWHDLHEAARGGGRHGVFFEAAFHLDQAQHHLRVEAGACSFVVHGGEKFASLLRIGNAAFHAF